MDTVGATSYSNLGTGVDEQASLRRCCSTQYSDCLDGQGFQLAGSQVFLAQLNVIHPEASALRDLLQQAMPAEGLVTSELRAVSDVVEQQGFN